VASGLLSPIGMASRRRVGLLDCCTAIVVAGTLATMTVASYVASRAEAAEALMRAAAAGAAAAEERYRDEHGVYLGDAPCSALPGLTLPRNVRCRLEGAGSARFRLTTREPHATVRTCVWDSGAAPPLVCG
jgi:Tfp pilus assembly protein PilE